MQNCWLRKIVHFAVPTDHRAKLKENERDKYLDLARKFKKLWNMKVTFISIAIGALGKVTERIIKGTGGLGNKRTSGDYPNYDITEISQNTEKSPRDLQSLKLQRKTIS